MLNFTTNTVDASLLLRPAVRRYLQIHHPFVFALGVLLAMPVAISASADSVGGVFIARQQFNARDLVYDPERDVLYATLPSTEAPHGDSIATIDPTTLEILDSVFVGSEPGQLEISADASRVYVGIDGSNGFRWWSPETGELGPLQVVTRRLGDPPVVMDFAIVPNDPTIVVVIKDDRPLSRTGELEVFDDNGSRSEGGVSLPGGDQIDFVDGETLLAYANGGNGRLTRYEFDGQALTELGYIRGLVSSSFGTGIEVGDDGLLYSTDGKVVDPSSLEPLGTFAFPSTRTQTAIEPAPQIGVTYALGNGIFSAFDNATFVECDRRDFEFPAVASELLRAGIDRLAYLSSDGEIGVFTGIPLFPDPSQSGPLIDASFSVEALGARDLVYDSERDLLYASIASTEGAPYGNTIASLDPATLQIVNSVFVGSEPTQLEISADRSRVYVGVDGASAFRVWFPGTDLVGPLRRVSTDAGNFAIVDDFAVSPVDPTTVIVSKDETQSSVTGRLEVFDDGGSLSSMRFGATQIHFIDDETVVGYLGSNSLLRYEFDGSVLTEVDEIRGLIPTTTTKIEVGSDQRVYTNTGRVVDPISFTLLGRFWVTGSDSAVEPVPALRLTYIFGDGTLKVFDNVSFDQLGSLDLGQSLTITELVSAGRDRLAYLSSDGHVGVIGDIPVRQVPEAGQFSLQICALAGLVLLSRRNGDRASARRRTRSGGLRPRLILGDPAHVKRLLR